MSTLEDISSLNREELLTLVAQLQGQIADLSAAIETLQAESDKLQRSTKRQTAPFSKVTRVNKPKRPGRKPGSDTFSFRQAPQPGEIIEPPVAVPVTLAAYPGWGVSCRGAGGLAYITDLSPIPHPKVTQYRG
jgi:hypothetical protein